MKQPKIPVFFYGSYINFDVLKEVDIIPERYQVAKLYGYDLSIQPLGNIFQAEEKCVYGIVVEATHPELNRLYTEHAEKKLGGIYLPEAVLVQTNGGDWMPAMTYISHDMAKMQADNAYVERIAKPAREFGFPKWYIEKIEQHKSR